MPPVPRPHRSRTHTWAWARRWAKPVSRAVWLALVFVFGIRALSDRWSDLRDVTASMTAAPLLASLGVALIGVGVSFVVWRELLGGLGARPRIRPAAGIFFVGQVSKYLPGSLWPVLTQMQLGRDHGIARSASAAAVGLFLAVHLLAGVAVAGVILPVTGAAPWPTAFVVLPCILLLHPSVWNSARRVVNGVIRRPIVPPAAAPQAIIRAAGAALVMWCAYGLHIQLISHGLGSQLGFLHATGSFAAAWAAGFLVLIAPAGAGVREVALTASLAQTMPPDAALATALSSRVVLTLADVLWAAAGGGGILRRPTPADDASNSSTGGGPAQSSTAAARELPRPPPPD